MSIPKSISEISEKTMIKVPIPLFLTILIGVLGFGKIYYKSESTTVTVDVLEQTVKHNEVLNREEREDIKDEFENDDEKMEARLMDYIRDEVGGLRADWERDKTEQDRRLNNLEK